MATRTDEELDRDWKPNGRRPQSTIARSFSAELMDIFRIENSVADLDEQVDRRKQQLSTQTSELEALEARIREMEARLQQRNTSPNSSLSQRSALAQAHAQHSAASQRLSGSSSSHQQQQQRRSPIAGVFPQMGEEGKAQPPPPLPEKDIQGRQARAAAAGQAKSGGSRPGTARQSQQAVPGALPPTPTSSDGEDA
ncbi:hypothetical protein GE09DRAFT_31897 [Coniochaeta sp. 2T2.1]|nr:hypothetical protein GE09DRAFT_31897 [Coniochaeta sp. 2T2.1]